jgi:hypothetical protein
VCIEIQGYAFPNPSATLTVHVVNPDQERLSVSEAAKLLGVTPEAIRARIRRGTIEHEKEDGHYYVFLTHSERVHNDVGNAALQDHVDTLKGELDARNRELEARNRELAEMRRLLAGALERIPAIEAPPDTPPSEPPGSSVSDPEGEGGGEMPPDTERRSWWQRWFGR